jgi:predicted dehydrogenase
MQRLVLVGAGFMAETHALNLTRMDDALIEAVVSPSGPEQFIEEFGLNATAHTDFKAAIEVCDANAVVICTPTHTHRDFIEMALDHGIAVFCEKPLATSLAEASAIQDAVVDASVPFMVGHVVRHFPEYTAAKREIDDGTIGRAGVARARRVSPAPDWGSDDWFAENQKSGGVFVDMAIHDFDYLRWVWGKVERVFARTTGDLSARHGTATLRFESGAVGYVEASWAQPSTRELTMELELAGDDGVIRVNSADTEPYRAFTNENTVVENTLVEDGYYRELAHFLDCLESGADPDIGIDEATAALRLSIAARQSAQNGNPVTPAEVSE